MTRLLEAIVALIIVAVLAVVIGLLMPSSGHVERTIEISHNMQHIEDVLNNFRSFPDYSALRGYEADTRFELSGEPYGVGAVINWQGDTPKVGSGGLEIVSSEPGQVVWALDNDWRGENKRLTVDVKRNESQKLVEMTWAYDVDYGWNLLDRYSQLYLHGDPASFIQYSMDGLQTVLANIPNIDYDDLEPRMVDTPLRPVLLVSTRAPRSLNAIAAATDTAMDQINAAMRRLGVSAAGPRVTFTTDWGETEYRFDVAVPIDASTLTINGQDYQLRSASDPVGLAGPEPASTGTAASAPEVDDAPLPSLAPQPGDYASDGMLIVDDNVRATMAFGGRALAADWTGSPAGLVLMRLGLKAYAATHGYDYNEYFDRLYDVMLSDLEEVAADDQSFIVYLPVKDAPERTPGQGESSDAGGRDSLAPAAGSSAAAAASSTVAEPATSMATAPDPSQ